MKKLAVAASWFLPATVLAGTGVTTITPSGKGIMDVVSVESEGTGFAQYLVTAHAVGVAAVAAVAVVMIVWGAVEIFGENVWGKRKGKEKVQNAILGLLLAAGSYVILKTISDSLLSADFSLAGNLGAEVSGVAIANPGSTGNTGGTTSNNRPGTGNTSGGATGAGSIAANAKAGMTFPDESWNAAALEAIKNSGILNLSPADAARYFPGGVPTAQGYLSILASIAKSESGFNPSDGLDHSQGYDVGNTYSVGLFSFTGGEWGYSEAELGNPYNSIDAAVKQLNFQITNSGSIAGGSGTGRTGHYWGPLYRDE